jgi:formylglycine-generating enzyme required for sulfatase activity
MPDPRRLVVLRRLGLALLGLLASLTVAPPAGADGIMLVQAGAFWMGRDDGPAEEAPMHRVFVADVWIERHKVTNAEFAEFLDAHGLYAPGGERRYDWDDPDARIHRTPAGPFRADAGFAHHPAVEVSWFGARDFCRARGRRLPTEAEWEKAARGSRDRRPYPWGWEPPTADHAVFGRAYNATERGDARPLGQSPDRIEDLLGNLREWTSSILRPYPYRRENERQTLAAEERVAVRGASHDDPGPALSVTARHSHDRRGAAAGHHHIGFRCATSEDLGEIAR